MIAFYAWTDTLLLNSVKVKCGSFPEEEADLFVLALPRVSGRLLDRIRSRNVFRRVIVIREPHEGLSGLLHKSVKLLSGQKYYRLFAEQLDSVRRESYRMLFTGGFWSYSLFLYRFLSQDNPELTLQFLEEGVSSYAGERVVFCCDPCSDLRSELMRKLFYADVFPRAKAAAQSLYLHMPEACPDGGQLELRTIPPVDAAANLSSSELTEETLSLYMERKVLIFLQPESGEDAEISERIIREAAEVFGGENLLIKLHQDDLTLSDFREIDPAIAVDRLGIPFDEYLPLMDWEDKLLIARSSSCLFYPLFQRRQEAWVLFYYRFFPAGELGNNIVELSERMRSLYRHPERVAVPGNYEELGTGMRLSKNTIFN